MIVHLTQDLMMSSTASSAARANGHKFKFVASAARCIELIQEHAADLLFVDLQTAGFNLDEFQSLWAKLETKPKCVCYAQHVMVDQLQAANASDCFDHVMTRGQFNSSVDTVIQELIAP